jgi:DNA-binding response OmpR family regulator
MEGGNLPGFGIGLNYALHLAVLHKGLLTVAPNLPKGSVFTLSVPSSRKAYDPSEIIMDTETSNENAIIPAEQATGMKDTTILVAEDNIELANYMRHLLLDEYNVILASNGVEAMECIKVSAPDIVISDIMMPKTDGFELAEGIRTMDKQVPILFMTAKDDKPSKLYAYRLGVDDYVVKPFDMDVFMLKVAALLRRAGIENSKTLTVGNLTMNAEEHTAYQDGEELSLTVREFDLLFKLLSYPKKTFTRSALMAEFWDYDSSATSRTVDVYMAKLREKTADCDGFEIVTVHGLGYKAVLK